MITWYILFRRIQNNKYDNVSGLFWHDGLDQAYKDEMNKLRTLMSNLAFSKALGKQTSADITRLIPNQPRKRSSYS